MPSPVLALDSTAAGPSVVAALTPQLAVAPKGYIVYLGGSYGATAAQVASLRTCGLTLGACYEAWPQTILASSTRGAVTGYAEAACRAAAALGFPLGSRIFGAVEASSTLSAQVVLDWAAAVVAAGYAPGLYVQPASPSVQNALAAARALSEDAAAIVLWVASYVAVQRDASGKVTLPEWAPPTCAGCAVAAWQFAEDVGTTTQADLTLMDLDAAGWYAPPAPPAIVDGFSDVPDSAWYASSVQQAVAAGLMDGTSATTFEPDAPVTRAQLAAVAARIAPRLQAVVAAAQAPGAPTTTVHSVGGDGNGTVTVNGMPIGTPAGDPGMVHWGPNGWEPYPDPFGAGVLKPRRHGPYGVRRSRPRPGLADHRAWTATTDPIPAAYTDPIMAALPVEDQQQSGMCVAFSGSEIRRWWLRKLGVADVELSAPYLYARAHQVSNTTAEGLEPVQAMEALHAYGIAPWAQDPLNPSSETVAQSEAASPATLDAAAKPYVVPTYGPVDVGDVAAMQQAIMAAPVQIAIPVPVEAGVENPIPDGQGGWNVVFPPGDNPELEGGHAIVLYGWKTDASGHLWWLMRNSWGADWASAGSAWLDSDHPIWECWSMTCAVPSACAALAQQVAELSSFLAQYGKTMPASHIAAVQAALTSAQQQQQALGCPV